MRSPSSVIVAGHEDEPHERRVERDGDRPAERDRLDRRDPRRDEGGEDGHHDRGSARDRRGTRREALRHGPATVTGDLEALADAGEQEHLVVHREAEDEREHDRGHRGLDEPGRFEAEQPVEPAPLEHDHDHAVRGRDREQVDDHRLQRDDERPQQEDEHRVTDEQHEEQDPPHRASDLVLVVELRRGRSADGDLRIGPRGRRQVVAPADDRRLRGRRFARVGGSDEEQGGAPVVRLERRRYARDCRVSREETAELGCAGGRRRPLRIRKRKEHPGLADHPWAEHPRCALEADPGFVIARQLAENGAAHVDAQSGKGEREQERRTDGDCQDGAASDAVRPRAPEGLGRRAVPRTAGGPAPRRGVQTGAAAAAGASSRRAPTPPRRGSPLARASGAPSCRSSRSPRAMRSRSRRRT